MHPKEQDLMYNIARDYILLAFAINQHLPGYIDAYFGPEEVKLEAESHANCRSKTWPPKRTA